MRAGFVGKICLGTAQFGLDYGIANKKGKLSKDEVFGILEYARISGIDTLDTAPSYGDSEAVIGEYMSQYGRRFKIISKLPHLDRESDFDLEGLCRRSLSHLRQEKMEGYLVHRFDDLRSNRGLFDRMRDLKEKGLVCKIGFSVYKTEDVEYILKNRISCSIIQLPYSIFDRRFERLFPTLKDNGIEIYARSVFLQGLFFLDRRAISEKFSSADDRMRKLCDIAAEKAVPLNSLCLDFVLLNPYIDKVVLGVDSRPQMAENIASYKYLAMVKEIEPLLKSLELSDEKVILPYNW